MMATTTNEAIMHLISIVDAQIAKAKVEFEKADKKYAALHKSKQIIQEFCPHQVPTNGASTFVEISHTHKTQYKCSICGKEYSA